MSVTIKQIAERTGLSIPTVGNVLGRAAHRYSDDTRKRVLAAARELGYMPNSSARAMRQGRFDCAALVLSRSHQSTHSHIPAGLLDGLDDELSLAGMHLAVSRLTDEELSHYDILPKVLREYMADGMIVNYTHEIPPKMLELIHAHHTPAVWINAKLAEDCVYPDEFAAAERVTEELLKLGHRRIALVHMIARLGRTGTLQEHRGGLHYSAVDRAAGFTSAMRRAGLAAQVLSHDQFIDESEHMDVCRSLLAGPERPTAVLVYSENEVFSVVCAARMLGLSIPRDLSVVLFTPMRMWVVGHEMSIAAVPTAEMGRRAVRMLLEKIKAPHDVCEAQAIAYGLTQHQTVGVAPGRAGSDH